MKAPVPILRSFDEAKALEFYRDFLGFEVVFRHRFDPELPLYMGLQHGDCVLHLSEHHGDAAPGATLRIEVPDVAAFCAALNDKRYGFARPGLQDQPWGARETSIADPFGNRLVFWSPL
ncbi:glyoxalase superfamily protein [Pararhodobacter sp. CCB-MM2]|uniref:glyoxalase superfamily protein n=1 Tax=Pararhodobacter sp. CCB-MM2 TaxID=1786003 RepID=UPI00082B63A8|nr:glyoxalase superfamily protein [Pararhodobacter sp. CCB-MM2]